MSATLSASTKAVRAWGNPPDWVTALAGACDASSQKAVADLIGYSRTTISLAVSGKYTRDQTALERAVRERLMRGTVDCPVLGQIDTEACRTNQALPFSSTNPTRIRLFQACRSCGHNSRGA